MDTRSSIRIGRIFGIDITLHFTWFLIAAILTFALAAHFREVNPGWSPAVPWLAAGISTVLFFAALLAHELAHCAVARRHDIPVRSITLFALGGVSNIEKEPAEASTEFWMAVAGPATSLAIGGAALGLAAALGWRPDVAPHAPVLAVITWLGVINLTLGVFNLVPGFPLDGGRVLRALAWWATGDAARATRIATRVGQAVALGLMAVGVLELFGGAGINGLWLALVGWFLLNAATATRARAELDASIRGVSVGDAMARDCPAVEAGRTLRTFVDEHLLPSGRRCFVVVDGGSVVGLVTLHEVKKVEQARWSQATLREVMRPLSEMHAVAPETPLSEAVSLLSQADVNQVPVLSSGQLVGVLTRGHLMRFLEVKSELAA